MNQFAENYAKKGLVRLREIFTPGTLTVPKTPAALKELESIHKVSFVTSIFWVHLNGCHGPINIQFHDFNSNRHFDQHFGNSSKAKIKFGKKLLWVNFWVPELVLKKNKLIIQSCTMSLVQNWQYFPSWFDGKCWLTHFLNWFWTKELLNLLRFLIGAKTAGLGPLRLVEFPVGRIFPRPGAGFISKVHLQHVSVAQFLCD